MGHPKKWTDLIIAGSLLGAIAFGTMCHETDWGDVWIRWNAKSYWTECYHNTKNIATALEMYSTDNMGRFPTSVERLVPEYIKNIPTCPTTGEDSYSGGFRSVSGPDWYTITCKSRHFRNGVPAELDYVSTTGGLGAREY
jgi:hypothetical protein